MNKLINAITLAIATILGYRDTIKAKDEVIASQESTIVDLRSKLEAEEADDAALVAAKEAAESKLAEAEAKGEELTAAIEGINTDPAIPVDNLPTPA